MRTWQPAHLGSLVCFSTSCRTVEPPLSENEPIYFSVGTRGDTTARFQLSFKYRLFDRQLGWGRDWPWLAGLHFAYTQTSIWNLSESSKPFLDIGLEEYERVMRVNLTGAWLCCQGVIPVMLRQKTGCIVNVSSVAGQRGGGLLGDEVGAPVDVGVGLLVEAVEGVEDRPWLLRGVGRVEVDQAPAAHHPLEDREVLLDPLDVEGIAGGGLGHDAVTSDGAPVRQLS